MKDIAMYIGLFMVGYLLTMGLVYVMLNLFTRKVDQDSNGSTANVIMKVSRGGAGKQTKDDVKAKMHLING